MRHSRKPMKDENKAQPIPDAWRPTIRELTRALVKRDYGVSRAIAGVAPVSSATAEHMRASISDYGETLTELPDETWSSSIAQWMGTHWDVLVDLWTVESGASDLVLSLRVRTCRRFPVRDRLRVRALRRVARAAVARSRPLRISR